MKRIYEMKLNWFYGLSVIVQILAIVYLEKYITFWPALGLVIGIAWVECMNGLVEGYRARKRFEKKEAETLRSNNSNTENR